MYSISPEITCYLLTLSKNVWSEIFYYTSILIYMYPILILRCLISFWDIKVIWRFFNSHPIFFILHCRRLWIQRPIIRWPIISWSCTSKRNEILWKVTYFPCFRLKQVYSELCLIGTPQAVRVSYRRDITLRRAVWENVDTCMDGHNFEQLL